MKTNKIYHAYRTTEKVAFEPIGAYPQAKSEAEVWSSLKLENKLNHRDYFMIDHFDPLDKKDGYRGPEQYDLDNDTAKKLFPDTYDGEI